MIKLIASDMDGTLLDENSNLPVNFFDTLKKLKQKNVKFVIASGRSYRSLEAIFSPYCDDLHFICDNGSYIVEPNKKPIVSIIPREDVTRIVKMCEDIPNVYPILCGIKYSYYKPCSKEIENDIFNYYKIQKKAVSDLKNIDDDIFKIAIYDPSGSKDNSYKILNPKICSKYKVVVSGENWIDINNLGINKGEALKKIQKDSNISYDETMSFGDFYNDIELLQNAKYSFVMENANKDMRQYANFIAKPNTKNGVIKTIEEYLSI